MKHENQQEEAKKTQELNLFFFFFQTGRRCSQTRSIICLIPGRSSIHEMKGILRTNDRATGKNALFFFFLISKKDDEDDEEHCGRDYEPEQQIEPENLYDHADDGPLEEDEEDASQEASTRLDVRGLEEEFESLLETDGEYDSCHKKDLQRSNDHR